MIPARKRAKVITGPSGGPLNWVVREVFSEQLTFGLRFEELEGALCRVREQHSKGDSVTWCIAKSGGRLFKISQSHLFHVLKIPIFSIWQDPRLISLAKQHWPHMGAG